MYYIKTVDVTPKARTKRRHNIPGKDGNTPSERLTEVGYQRLYKDASKKKTTLVYDHCKDDFLECMYASKLIALDTRSLPFLKDTLAETLQIYFTEKYMCHFLEEASSVYYSKDQVKVCPAVIHYKGVNGVLETQNLALLSDEMAQCCTIKVVVGWIKHVSTGTAQS